MSEELYRGSTLAGFTYDADGVRVKRTAGGATTVYPSAGLRAGVGDSYEKNLSTGVVTKYYSAGGRRVAMRAGSTLSYLYTDHLGSTAITANSTGGFVAELRYWPYGAERPGSGTTPTDRRFTGQRWDGTISLYDYRARYYDPYLPSPRL